MHLWSSMGLKDVKAATHEILDFTVVSFLLTEASEYLTTYARASLVAQMVKNLPAMQEDPGAIPRSERSPGEGNVNPLQYSCLENPMDRGAWCDIQSIGSQRIGHNRMTNTFTCAGFPRCISGKEPACQCRRHERHGFYPWIGRIPWRRAWQPTLVFLPGESHGQMLAAVHRVS